MNQPRYFFRTAALAAVLVATGCSSCEDRVDDAANSMNSVIQDGDASQILSDMGAQDSGMLDASEDSGASDVGGDTAVEDVGSMSDADIDLGESDVCGDGVVSGAEACDDSNQVDGDYCAADCLTVTGSCGDGTAQANESCDDGNVDAGDYCAANCLTVTGFCGDGTTQTNESCDDANGVGGDYCAADCQAITGACGDSTLQPNEACDDGVTADCVGTHDGGTGACVPVGTCSSGYMLDGTGACVTNNTTGLTTPCSLGTGYTVFKFHYSNNSTSAAIDVWDASCSYSFASGSACNVREVYPGFGNVSRTSDGYPIATSSHYIRVRYSVAGLSFTNATLYVQARSYSTGASTNIEAWSPIYGSIYAGPVDNDFVYDWYGIDWSTHLSPTDQPSLTAIQLYAYQGSGSLAVKAVELCVE